MLRSLDALLAARGRFAPGHPDPPLRTWTVAAVCGGAIHGAVMGASNGLLLQVFYSAVKVPLLFAATWLVVAPNTVVLHLVLGLQGDARRVFAAVAAAQASFGLALAALAPVTLFAYACAFTYEQLVALNGLEFLVALLAGHLTLRRHYAPLVARNPTHRKTARLWTTLYGVVAIQAAWMLRPFIGWKELPPTFVRSEVWNNAYLVVWELVRRLLQGH